EPDLESAVEQADAVVRRDQHPDLALRCLDPVDVEAHQLLEPVGFLELAIRNDRGLETDLHRALARLRPLFRHALTSATLIGPDIGPPRPQRSRGRGPWSSA